MIKCDGCKKNFEAGNAPDGTPNGVGFVTGNKTVSICRDCLIKLGMMSDRKKNEFFKRITREV